MGDVKATFDTYCTLNVTTGGDPLKTPLTMTGIMNEPLHVTGNYGTCLLYTSLCNTFPLYYQQVSSLFSAHFFMLNHSLLTTFQ